MHIRVHVHCMHNIQLNIHGPVYTLHHVAREGIYNVHAYKHKKWVAWSWTNSTVRMHTPTRTRTPISTHACSYAHPHTHACTHTHARTHACMRTHTHTHTHKHAHVQEQDHCMNLQRHSLQNVRVYVQVHIHVYTCHVLLARSVTEEENYTKNTPPKQHTILYIRVFLGRGKGKSPLTTIFPL